MNKIREQQQPQSTGATTSSSRYLYLFIDFDGCL